MNIERTITTALLNIGGQELFNFYAECNNSVFTTISLNSLRIMVLDAYKTKDYTVSTLLELNLILNHINDVHEKISIIEKDI